MTPLLNAAANVTVTPNTIGIIDVNTTSAAVGWRNRLLGVFHSPYQPTQPDLFREMLAALKQQNHFEFHDFVFVDLGSGKGRTLLMASDYPFRRIVGVELLPALHEAAQENLSKYRSESQKCFALESICADATGFSFPAEPMVLYLFNPFPESGLRRMMANLEQSLREHPRAVYALYHNPLLEHALSGSAGLRKLHSTHQYALYGIEVVRIKKSQIESAKLLNRNGLDRAYPARI